MTASTIPAGWEGGTGTSVPYSKTTFTYLNENSMTSRAFACGLALAAALPACTWSSESGTINRRYVSPTTYSKEADVDWTGEPLQIDNESGNLEIVGVPGLERISIEARPYAGAQNDEDAEAAFADVVDSIRIERVPAGNPTADVFLVSCPNASHGHGSVDRATTGCDAFVVNVPAGTVDAPLDLAATASFGGILATDLVGDVNLRAPFGISASVVPAKDSTVSLVNDTLVMGDCPVTLAVPADFSADRVEMGIESGLGEVDVTDFPDLHGIDCTAGGRASTCLSQERGAFGGGAELVEVKSSIGDAVLLRMDASGRPSRPLPWDDGACAKVKYEAQADIPE